MQETSNTSVKTLTLVITHSHTHMRLVKQLEFQAGVWRVLLLWTAVTELGGGTGHIIRGASSSGVP